MNHMPQTITNILSAGFHDIGFYWQCIDQRVCVPVGKPPAITAALNTPLAYILLDALSSIHVNNVWVCGNTAMTSNIV